MFFIRFLTNPGDLVVGIFAGSNTTGQVAEAEGRRWLAFEERDDYVAAFAFRFLTKDNGQDEMREVYGRVMAGEAVDLSAHVAQRKLALG